MKNEKFFQSQYFFPSPPVQNRQWLGSTTTTLKLLMSEGILCEAR